MRFEHEFTVDVPLEHAWRTLADPGSVSASLPESKLRAVDGIHTGRIELDSARGLACEATITGVDQDDDEHVATVAVHGRQVDGPGIGSAIVRSHLRERSGSTTVTLTADVLTTGHAPGNGFETAARGIFEAVAKGIERCTLERPPAAATPPPSTQTPELAAPPAVRQRAPLERLDDKRLIGGAAALVIAAAALRRMRRSRRRF